MEFIMLNSTLVCNVPGETTQLHLIPDPKHGYGSCFIYFVSGGTTIPFPENAKVIEKKLYNVTNEDLSACVKRKNGLQCPIHNHLSYSILWDDKCICILSPPTRPNIYVPQYPF